MVRRGPASVYRRKSSSKRLIEDCPDRSRPPPCMPDDDPAVWSAGESLQPMRLPTVASAKPECSPSVMALRDALSLMRDGRATS